MKKDLLFSLCLLFVIKTQAQVIENGHFWNNSGNMLAFCSNLSDFAGAADCINDLGSNFPNWTRTHGTPHFTPINDCPDIFIHFADDEGEGIAGGYPFKTGKIYEIHVGARFTVGTIRLVAGKNPRPLSTFCTEIDCGSEEGGGNVVPPFPSFPISASHPTRQEIFHPTFTFGDNSFLFIPNKDMDWIAIFPDEDDIVCDPKIRLMYLQVRQLCQAQLFKPELNISAGSYDHFENIYAGSVYGTNPITQVNGQQVIFEASQQITISQNFLSTPTNGNYFLAHIKPCDVLPAYALFDCFYASKMAGDTSQPSMDMSNITNSVSANRIAATDGAIRVDMEKGGLVSDNGKNKGGQLLDDFGDFVISPNPTRSFVKVDPVGNVTFPIVVTVTDINGKELIRDNFNGSANIDLSQYAPGIYLMNIQSKESNKTTKITKY